MIVFLRIVGDYRYDAAAVLAKDCDADGFFGNQVSCADTDNGSDALE